MIPVPLHAFNPGPMTGDGNWTWLLLGRVPTLIDAGTGDERHLAALQDALGGSVLAQVIVTHGHVDHASGAPALAARYPGARFLKVPWPDRDSRYPVRWDPLPPNLDVQAGDAMLRVVPTPGHAPDHVCLWDAASRSVFCGDLAVKGTTVFIPSGPDGDLAAYVASLERIRDLQPLRLLPAHGPVIDEPAKVIDSYIAHRHQRERQVLDALRAGDVHAEAIVTRIYRGVRPELLPMARHTVVAHLIKLEREGRVRRDEDAWHMIGS